MAVEKKRIDVLLADDHPIVREGIAALLSNEPDLQIVGEASDGDETLEMIWRLAPDVVLLDLNMPKLTGLQVIRCAREFNTRVRFGVLSIRSDCATVTEALKIGATAFLLKTEPPRDLVRAVRIIMDGGTYLSPGINGGAWPDGG